MCLIPDIAATRFIVFIVLALYLVLIYVGVRMFATPATAYQTAAFIALPAIIGCLMALAAVTADWFAARRLAAELDRENSLYAIVTLGDPTTFQTLSSVLIAPVSLIIIATLVAATIANRLSHSDA